MTRASSLKPYDLGNHEEPYRYRPAGKFGLENVSADHARHTESAIQAPDALPVTRWGVMTRTWLAGTLAGLHEPACG